MKCKKCNFENTESAKFCRNCGNSLEESFEEQPKRLCNGVKRPNKIFIVLTCIALLIAGVLVTTVFLADGNKGTVENSELAKSFLSTQELSSTSKKMFAYMADGEHQKAIDLYKNKIQGNYEKESEISSVYEDYYEKINDEFLKGNITQEIATAERDKLVKVAGSCRIDYDFENDAYFEDICDSKENYDMGCQKLEKEEFLSAYNYFNAVLEEDGNYQDSLLKINEVIEKYKDKTMKLAKEKADSSDYLGAYETVQSSMDLLDGNVEIREALISYEEMYAQKIVEDAKKVFVEPKNDYIAAIGVIEGGLNDFPNNNLLNTQLSYYNTFEPKYVYDMRPIRGSATDYDEETDTYGKVHTNSFCVGYGRSWGIWHETDATYDLSEGSYDTFTATIYGRSTKTEPMNMSVQIYADDKLVYENNEIPDNSTKPFDITVDISGASELRIVLDVYDNLGSLGYGIGMTNMVLQRTK